MSINIVNPQLLKTWQEEGTFNPDGSAEFTVTYKVPWSEIFSYIPEPLQPHPTFPALLYYDGRVSKQEGGMGLLVNFYRGIYTDNPVGFEQVEGNITATSEPIETAPIFAGPPGTDPALAPLRPTDINAVNLALTNNTDPNYPAGYGPEVPIYYNKRIRGIDSFFRPGFSWRRHYCSSEIPTYTNLVGYIVIPPQSPYAPPTPPTGQNYLFSGIGWRQQGGVVTIDEEYQLSGPGGWDIDLYTYPGI